MFDVDERRALRDRLVSLAHDDPEIAAAVLVGSVPRGAEDRWSDVDLALVLAPGASRPAVVERWTRHLQAEGLVDRLDVEAAGALYRVFLLRSTLQVDLSFWPPGGFVSGSAPVAVLFGDVDGPRPGAADDEAGDHLRRGWLWSLHARSALRRGRPWQTRWMLDALRQEVVVLACLRSGLPTHEGRGTDALPADVRAQLAGTLVDGLDGAALHRAFEALVSLLLHEAEEQRLPLPPGLRATLAEIVRTAADQPGR